MTSQFVDFMEKSAYYHARDELCIPERASGKIAMPELFDMIVGSETGAIIAAALVIPNSDSSSPQINKYFANTTSEWFRIYGPHLYTSKGMPMWANILIVIAVILINGAIVYFIMHYYLRPKAGYVEALDHLSLLVEYQLDCYLLKDKG